MIQSFSERHGVSTESAILHVVEYVMSSYRPRILIADDHKLMAELCQKILESEFDVVGTVADGRELVRTAVKVNPDVVLLDIGMPLLNGLDAGKQLRDLLPTVKLVYVTMVTDPEVALEAFHRGASGYLLKTCAAAELVPTVRAALRGNTHLSPDLKAKIAPLRRRQKYKCIVGKGNPLTERQREVLQLLAEGKAMKEIGDILDVSTKTVAFHKYRIMEALGAKNNAELVRYAIRNHILVA
jgi:DNA-binding NarL/FixJ family response regulator